MQEPDTADDGVLSCAYETRLVKREARWRAGDVLDAVALEALERRRLIAENLLACREVIAPFADELTANEIALRLTDDGDPSPDAPPDA